jgi:hypothetical protein
LTESTPSAENERLKVLVPSVSVGSAVILAGVIGGFWFWRKRKAARTRRGAVGANQMPIGALEMAPKSPSLPAFLTAPQQRPVHVPRPNASGAMPIELPGDSPAELPANHAQLPFAGRPSRPIPLGVHFRENYID